MNYLPFVSWGFYGTTTARKRACFFASWGLMELLPTGGVVSVIAKFMAYYRRRRM